MKIVHRHILGDYVLTFVVTFCVVVFVMSLGAMFKASDLIARGISSRSILQIFLLGLPSILPFAVPMSALTSALLVFSRLSADGETTAMKACGISMWQITSRPILFSCLLSALCMYVNADIAPRSHYAWRRVVRRLGMESPLSLIEKGHFIRDFPGLVLYVGDKKGNRLEDIVIYDLHNPGIRREIRAEYGEVSTDGRTDGLLVNLFRVRVDPLSYDRKGAGYCDSMPLTIPLGGLQDVEYEKRNPDMTLYELVESIRDIRAWFPSLKLNELQQQRMSLVVELNERIALSLACFSFVMLGIPLGIKRHRKESTIGVAVSLFLVFCFYMFIIIADSLVTRPSARPDLIVWLPVIIAVTLGLHLVRRSN